MEQAIADTAPEIQYPLLGERVQSTFIDLLFIVLLMFVFSAILEKYEHVPNWIRVVLFISIWILYDPVCTVAGFTIGNYVKGLRVRQFKDPSKRINIIQAIVRYMLKLFLGWISFMTINTNKERRAIHDFVAGTVVIKL